MGRMSYTNYGIFTFHYQAIGHFSLFFTKQHTFNIADLGGGRVFPTMEAKPKKGYLFQDLRNMKG